MEAATVWWLRRTPPRNCDRGLNGREMTDTGGCFNLWHTKGPDRTGSAAFALTQKNHARGLFLARYSPQKVAWGAILIRPGSPLFAPSRACDVEKEVGSRILRP
jgi:hypothetical protein